MRDPDAPQYWLFQTNPGYFRLREALQAGALQSFAVKAHKKKIHIGDKVILWQTGKNAGCYALCTVASDVGGWKLTKKEKKFFLKPAGKDKRVRLKVDYNLWNRPVTRDILPDGESFSRFYAGMPGTNYKATALQYNKLAQLVQQMDLVNEPEVEYYTSGRNSFALNTILYGPPGTGKTYSTINYALSIIEDRTLQELALEDRQELRHRFDRYREQNRIHFVTFHQSFSYEDFVEGIKPHSDPQQRLIYEVEDGIFKIACMEARRSLAEALNDITPGAEEGDAALTDIGELNESILENCRKHVLIIDEINRGNIASIFGELITLIDKDKREGASERLRLLLPYSKTEFSVPPNLYIIGTMNTTDRSIESMDMALRRRFHFISIRPEPALIGRLQQNPITPGIDLQRLLQAINERIEILLDSNYRIGHSYFLGISSLDDLRSAFEERILPLLEEYFLGDPGKIGLVLGKSFLKELSYDENSVFSDFQDEYAGDLEGRKLFRLRQVKELNVEDFIRIYDKKYHP